MNYLLIFNKHYIKNPGDVYRWGLGRGVFCKRLFEYILDELKLDPQDIGNSSRLEDIKDLNILERMIKNLCENINKLDASETYSLIGTDVMNIIIMEIWLSLKNFYKHDEREVALKDYLELIENEVVIERIKSMDLHFKQHHFRDDPSKSQF